MSKLDHTTNPSRAWKVEDGVGFFLSDECVKQCDVCGKWYVDENLQGVEHCKFKRIERKIQERLVEAKQPEEN